MILDYCNETHSNDQAHVFRGRRQNIGNTFRRGTRLPAFMQAWFFANAIDFVHRRGFQSYCACIDCMAVASVINPGLVETRKYHVGVETKDGLTLGMTVRDGRHHFIWKDLPEIDVAVGADYQGFLDLLKEVVLA